MELVFLFAHVLQLLSGSFQLLLFVHDLFLRHDHLRRWWLGRCEVAVKLKRVEVITR